MLTAEEHIKQIQEKVQLLLKQQAALAKENRQLREQLHETQLQAEESIRQAEALRQQVEIGKYTNGTMDEKEKKEFEKKISRYVKEIDRCIALLRQ
ncbi:hypothetical protein JMG10_25165 [Nostoc ellipsosporum NOK]|nr:hypothetical protein [Nostoc ellipsosporum NOK]